MSLTLWIIAGLVAAVFLVAGASKLFVSPEKLARAPGGGWVNDFSAGTVKALGAVEILGAAGLILPAALDITPVLVPLAAVGLATIMLGAAIVMIRPAPERRAATDVAWFHSVVRQVFLHRRKNLRHVLSEMWAGSWTKADDALLASLGLDGRLRAEALDVDQFRRLSQVLKERAEQVAENVPDSQAEEARF